MLNLVKLEKRYGENLLFSDVSLQFPDSGVVGLVGPNGAGKSTLMRILMGEESPDEGEVVFRKGTTIAYLGQEVESYAEGSVLDVALAGFAEILDMERRLAELAAQAADTDNLDAVLEEMGRVQNEFERVEGYSLVERARSLLSGLGFSAETIDGEMATLSGGWKMRVVLAQLLLQQPDVLLLDEPTNHLDIDAILWLEGFLADYGGLIVLTSHDRSFLDRMCDYILAFEFDGLHLEPGNYSHYEASLEVRIEQAEHEASVAQREKERLERFVERFKAKATKARQAQSRAKQIERMEIPEVKNPRPPQIHIRLPEPLRTPRVVAELDSVVKSFDDNVIFDGINWRLEREQKVAVVGPNGAGKTTMLRLLTGELEPNDGRVQLGEAVEMGYFAQHHLEALEPDDTVLDVILNAYSDTTIGEARSVLGGFLFSGDDVKKRVRVLSGGERARLSLAKLFFRPKNLLILDEPTNHLDMASIEVLAKTLRKFSGAVVAVSHDRSFLNRFVDHVVDLHPGEFDAYAGNMSDYETNWLARQARLARSGSDHEAKLAEKPSKTAKAKDSPQDASGGGQDYRARKRIQSEFRACMKQLQEIEANIERLTQTLHDPANASDHQQLLDVQAKLDAARTAETDAMQRWEQLVDQGKQVGLDLLDAT